MNTSLHKSLHIIPLKSDVVVILQYLINKNGYFLHTFFTCFTVVVVFPKTEINF